ncbi:MAG: HEAT repeat domain-containing protein [Candidatus Marinimicrobia bacterium]|nr:HEAT repeat domain-containing protein [Candidatus Neomarinimicrobiota bacterium]
MSQEVSTVNPTFSPSILWSEGIASTDINLYPVRYTTKDLKAPSTYLLEMYVNENDLKRYLDYKTASLYSPFFFFRDSFFPKQTIFSDLMENATYGSNKIRIYQVELDNSTASQEQILDINEDVESLFELANEEEFEDGMESEFSRKLISFIIEHGNNSIEALVPILISEKANAEIISEALRWIGRIEHLETESLRLWLLEYCLLCPSPSVRDGATLGLASMNDPSAIIFLKVAIDKESINELREDMKQVLSQLETSEDAASFEKNQKE